MKLGKTGLNVSKIGLGTWAIGGGPAFKDTDDKAVSIATIQAALKNGINFIDTAPGYNFGNSEKIVGEAIKGNREEYTIITKCGITWERKGALFNKVGDRQLYKNLSPESIALELKDSLKRLQTDYIDIYMTHWPSVEPYKTSVKETMTYLMGLKKKGIIKGIGAANVNADDVREYLRYGELDIVQAKYSILDREVEGDLLPLCKKNDIVLQAYSPLAMGILSGTIGRDYVPAKGSAQNGKKWFEPKKLAAINDMLDAWASLTDKYNCSLANLAIAWVLAQGNNVNVLSGSTTPEQLDENSKAMHINLAPADAADMLEMAKKID
ncbi:aldo/keto reductase [Lactobacillus sp. UCMA15818]|uniref:aldo/keto reductase n=1 Tax=Lactobacillus sp. UCMA15818 TaxID=2583394 RepID=UPI0025AF33FA|nr:aldo/keto reductase [Lactobacillus sp. UCMA15818]